MRLDAMMLLAAGTLAAADAPKDEAAKELGKLQGAWSLVSAKHDGKDLPEKEAKKTRIVFKGDTFAFPAASGIGTSRKGTIKVYPGKSPKWMDAAAATDAAKGAVSLGIYAVEGDDYKVCFAPPGKDRPKAFASSPGSGHVLQVWKRKKE